MARRIIWSIRARQDRKSIFSYWNDHNKSKLYSKKLNRLLNEAIRFLSLHPQVGRKTILENIHEVVRHYLIIYELTEEEIIVHTIWDGHRDNSGLGIV